MPKVIARLPFIERPGHPAGTPVFVVSKPLAGPAARDVVLYAARFERWREEKHAVLTDLGGELIASAGVAGGLSALLALPERIGPEQIAAAFASAGGAPTDVAEVGSHAERFRVKS
jgi:hypothetical protein